MNFFRKNWVRFTVCGAALVIGGALPAKADLVGSSVTVSGKELCASEPLSGPTGCTLFDTPSTQVIAAGGTTFPLAASDGTVTVTGDQLIWTATAAANYGGSAFNGFEFQISGAPAITSVSVDAATNLGPATNNYASGFLLVGGNTVWMDLNSLSASVGEQTILDLSFTPIVSPAPEPTTLALLGSGIAGVTLFRRKRRR